MNGPANTSVLQYCREYIKYLPTCAPRRKRNTDSRPCIPKDLGVRIQVLGATALVLEYVPSIGVHGLDRVFFFLVAS